MRNLTCLDTDLIENFLEENKSQLQYMLCISLEEAHLGTVIQSHYNYLILNGDMGFTQIHYRNGAFQGLHFPNNVFWGIAFMKSGEIITVNLTKSVSILDGE